PAVPGPADPGSADLGSSGRDPPAQIGAAFRWRRTTVFLREGNSWTKGRAPEVKEPLESLTSCSEDLRLLDSSVLEIKSVDVGVVAIRALSSNYYLALSRKGDLYGAEKASSSGLSQHLTEIPRRYVAGHASSPCRPAADQVAHGDTWVVAVATDANNKPPRGLRIEENKYNTYASAEWRNKKKHMFVGLSANGKPMKGRKTRRKNTATHFLPIVVQPR
ncbi:hypothetical protein CRUP_036199, partial [Coryphaenoides rupestris]